VSGGVVTDRQQRLQAMMRSFEEQAAKAGAVREVMKDLRGVGRSRDGAVTVTTAPSGAVLGLQLSPGAMSRSHVALQQEILDAIRMATQNAAQQLDAALAPILGERLAEFKQGMAASGVEPILPSAPPPPGPQAGFAQPGPGSAEPGGFTRPATGRPGPTPPGPTSPGPTSPDAGRPSAGEPDGGFLRPSFDAPTPGGRPHPGPAPRSRPQPPPEDDEEPPNTYLR
jgi:DNA-binding protein YbaB